MLQSKHEIKITGLVVRTMYLQLSVGEVCWFDLTHIHSKKLTSLQLKLHVNFGKTL